MKKISKKTADQQASGKQGVIYKNTLVNKDPGTLSDGLMLSAEGKLILISCEEMVLDKPTSSNSEFSFSSALG